MITPQLIITDLQLKGLESVLSSDKNMRQYIKETYPDLDYTTVESTVRVSRNHRVKHSNSKPTKLTEKLNSMPEWISLPGFNT